MRLAEGKTDCRIFDIASTIERVGGDVNSAPSLEGIDPSHFENENENDVNENKDNICKFLSYFYC